MKFSSLHFSHPAYWRDTGAGLHEFSDYDANQYRGDRDDLPEFGSVKQVAHEGGFLEEEWFFGGKDKKVVCPPLDASSKSSKLLSKLGKPKASLYEYGQAFFRHNGETAEWEISTQRKIKGGVWKTGWKCKFHNQVIQTSSGHGT